MSQGEYRLRNQRDVCSNLLRGLCRLEKTDGVETRHAAVETLKKKD